MDVPSTLEPQELFVLVGSSPGRKLCLLGTMADSHIPSVDPSADWRYPLLLLMGLVTSWRIVGLIGQTGCKYCRSTCQAVAVQMLPHDPLGKIVLLKLLQIVYVKLLLLLAPRSPCQYCKLLPIPAGTSNLITTVSVLWTKALPIHWESLSCHLSSSSLEGGERVRSAV